jgi:outer membrane immunogenic protein
MSVRTLGMVTGMAVIAAFSAQAVAEPAEDIVGPVAEPQTVMSTDTPPPISASAPPPISTSAPPPGSATPPLVAPPTPLAATPVSATAPAASPYTAPPPADLPTTAASQSWALPDLDTRWSGFYGGANVGYGWTAGTSGSSCTNTVTNTQSGCTLIPESGPNPSAPVGGGQVGYMAPIYPGGHFPVMIGGEVDLQGTGLSGTQSIAPPIPLSGFPPCTTCSFFAKESLSWLASLRARVGVPIGRVLVYGTGGLMFGGANVTQSISFSNTSAATYSSASKADLSGPTFGGGVEFLADGPWSVRLEGLYYDLGTIRTVAQPTGTAFINFNNEKTFAFRGGIVRLAVNFHFGDFGGQ